MCWGLDFRVSGYRGLGFRLQDVGYWGLGVWGLPGPRKVGESVVKCPEIKQVFGSPGRT